MSGEAFKPTMRALILGHFSTVGDIDCLTYVTQMLREEGTAYDVVPFIEKLTPHLGQRFLQRTQAFFGGKPRDADVRQKDFAIDRVRRQVRQPDQALVERAHLAAIVRLREHNLRESVSGAGLHFELGRRLDHRSRRLRHLLHLRRRYFIRPRRLVD